MVANTEQRTDSSRAGPGYSTLLLTHLTFRRQNQQSHQEASKGDRRIMLSSNVSSGLAFILVTAITQSDGQSTRWHATGCYGQTVYVVRVVIITVIFVLVDKQTLSVLVWISKNTPYIAAEINATVTPDLLKNSP